MSANPSTSENPNFDNLPDQWPGDEVEIFLDYIDTFGRNRGLFILTLLHFAGSRMRDDGWFLCTVEDLSQSMKWPPGTQARYLKYFINRKLIEVRKNKHNQRVIRLNIRNIERATTK